jgi:vancomycin resistance protein YoaR
MQKKFITGMLALTVWAMGSLVTVTAADSSGVISDGVFIGDQDVSGMTAEEALSYVKGEVERLENSVITIQMGDDSISRTWKDLGLTWENTDLVEEISQIGTTGNIVRRYKEQKDLQNQNSHYEIEYSLDEDAEEAFVEACAAFNSEPVEGTVYLGDDGLPHVSGGTDGLTLDADATLEALQEHLSQMESGDQVIEAVVDRVSPVLTAEMLSQMDDVLGTATTDYSASSAARVQNVETGTAKINGTLFMPGESFSVTSAVVPFTAENGYALAPSYEAGQVVDSYGGGICQVSTTLYNAVLKAELEVDQRSNHTMIVTYVDPSKDAAIAEGIMDLVFTNNQEYPVYIVGSAYSGTLNFTIFGVETRPANRTIEYVSETISEEDMSNKITLVAKTDQAVGYLVQTSSPHQGLSAVLWKNVYVDGVLTETTQVNSSTYQASNAIYEVGVMTDNTALSAALYTAIGQNDLTQVQSLLTYGVQTTTQTETTAQTDASGTATGTTTTDTTQLVDPPEDDSYNQ